MVGRVSRMSEPSRNLLTVSSLEGGFGNVEGCSIGDIFENSGEDFLPPLQHHEEAAPLAQPTHKKKNAKVEFVQLDSTDKPVNFADHDDVIRAKIFDEIRK
ncbi:hypothetical protein DMENIID0001_029530 [Sergentomyia squamirostris]